MRQCPVCSGEQFQDRFYPPHSPGRVVRCKNCGMVFIPVFDDTRAIIAERLPVPEQLRTSSDWGLVINGWEAPILKEREREFAVNRRNTEQAFQRLEKFTSKGRLLDFGCGGGFQLDVAQAAGWQVTGLEPLPGHAIYARAKFGLNVVNDVLQEDTFPDASFDAITAFQVFEHLPDPNTVLRLLIKALKPGGALLVEVPNINDLLTRILGPRSRHFVPDHVNFFSQKTLEQFMKKYALRPVSIFYPTRTMTQAHLIDWIRKMRNLLPAQNRDTQKAWSCRHTMRLNLHDILEIIAVK